MKKRFLAKHAKSSAFLVSVGIHALLVVIALSFVAVTVITKDEQKFEAKPVNRPKMQLKKLQVPVNVKKKKTQKPKLRKRIVVKPKLNQTMPDVKMPEITGVKGGMGNMAGAGLGGAGGLGFSMPEIEIFGVKGKGEKIFLILDTDNKMLVDAMGGIPAYTIIKQELIRIVEELPPTALFNVCVFGGGAQTAFPLLVPANDVNTAKVKAWLEPLNTSDDWSKSSAYGLKTLGRGGVAQSEDLRIGNFAEPVKSGGGVYDEKWKNGEKWFRACMVAMKQQADTIFLLTNDWGYQRASLNKVMDTDEWIKNTPDGKKWAANLEKGKKLLEAENKTRAAAGKPPKVISSGRWGIVATYFPDSPKPPSPEWYYFQPKEFTEAFMLTRKKYEPKEMQLMSGLKKKKNKIDFNFNVIQFIQANGEPNSRSLENFNKLTGMCKGEYQTVAGLEEIQNYASAE